MAEVINKPEASHQCCACEFKSVTSDLLIVVGSPQA